MQNIFLREDKDDKWFIRMRSWESQIVKNMKDDASGRMRNAKPNSSKLI